MLTTVARFIEPWEAHLLRGRLEAEGIFAVVHFDQMVYTNYSYAWAYGGVRVQVIEADLAQALAIERQCRAGEYRTFLDVELGGADSLTCPNCGSEDYKSRRSSSVLLLLLAALLLGIVFPMRIQINRCNRRGHKWTE